MTACTERYAVRSGDPVRRFGVDGGLLFDVAARSVAWLAVLVAVLVAARRTAIGLAVVGLLVELAAIVVWLPANEFHAIRMSWAPVLALFTVVLLGQARRSRPATAIVGRRGLLLITASLALTSLGAIQLRFWQVPAQILGLITVPDALLAVAAALLLTGLLRIPGPVRRRTLALLATAAAIPFAQNLLEVAIGINLARVVTPGMVVLDVLMLAGVPLLAFGLAVAALHMRENITVSVTRESQGVSPTGAADK